MAQPVQAPSGLPYGERGQLEQAQQAMPLPSATPPPPPLPLHAPTQRPSEPVTAGVAVGPGPGPAELGIAPAGGGGQDVMELLRAIAQAYPTDEMLELAYSQPGWMTETVDGMG